MPRKEHLRGAGGTEQRMFEEIRGRATRSGRRRKGAKGEGLTRGPGWRQGVHPQERALIPLEVP